MSKYQPRIIINDPEKRVPKDIIAQFFLTIRTGDIDKIRDFVDLYKNKYNLVERPDKDSTIESNKTPFHAVLELDDKTADNNQKLRIMQFLDQMGAPMELPDSADVWPIHEAAALQSEKIMQFFINKNVSVNRKDSSNNTPLHYAIVGKQIDCPKAVSVGQLAPAQKIDSMPLNLSLRNANNVLTKMLSTDKDINKKLIHMINTIMKIPQMYVGTDTERYIESSIIEIFSDTALTSTYSGGITDQQNKLVQLINDTYSTINENLLRGVTNPLPIGPNKGGWGPTVPVTGSAAREPTDTERILENNQSMLRQNIVNDYNTIRNSAVSINAITLDNKLIPALSSTINTISYMYVNKLIYCPECDSRPAYGETTMLAKMLYLLIWNDYLIKNKPADIHLSFDNNYVDHYVDIVMQKFALMNNNQHNTIETLASNLDVPSNVIYKKSSGSKPVAQLFQASVDFISRIVYLYTKDSTDELFYKISTNLSAKYTNCIKTRLASMFANSNDTKSNPINLLGGGFFTIQLSNLATDPNGQYTKILNDYIPVANQATNWIGLLDDFIKSYQPQNTTNPNIFSYNGAYGIPRTPLPRPPTSTLQVGILNKYTYYELFRIMQMLTDSIIKNQYTGVKYPNIFAIPIAEWGLYVNSIGNEIDSKSGQPIGTSIPIFIGLYQLLVRRTQYVIINIITKCITSIINNKGNLFDNAYMYSLLLPYMPTSKLFDHANIDAQKVEKWDTNNKLVAWFNTYVNTIPKSVVDNIVKIIKSDTYKPSFTYDKFNAIREKIESDITKFDSTITDIVTKPEFRKNIRYFFGLNRDMPNNGRTPRFNPADNLMAYFKNPLVPIYDEIAYGINFPDRYAENKARVDKNEMPLLFFLTETYGHFFLSVGHKFRAIDLYTGAIRSIVMEIITFSNNNTYYHIAQIFLPAMVKAIIVCINILFEIRSIITDFQKKSLPLTENNVDTEYREIIALGIQFIEYCNRQTEIIYAGIIDTVNYHNSVIKFLNTTSAYHLITGSNSNLFDMNLEPIEALPLTFGEMQDWEPITKIIKLYRVPEINYYETDIVIDYASKINFAMVFGPIKGPPPQFDNYGQIIYYDREPGSIISDSPVTGQNSQLNIGIVEIPDPTDSTKTVITYTINPIHKAIAGEWLLLNNTNVNTSKFYNAFISYNTAKINFDYLNGMPPSIKQLANKHLISVKQEIIEDVVQKIVDNHAKDDSDATKDQALEKIYSEISAIGTDTSFEKIDNAKIYIVIAKLTDSLVNKILEYSTKQSINNWIYANVSDNLALASNINMVDQTIKIVNENNYLKLSLKDLDQASIDQILNIGPEYADYRLTQIEQNPTKLAYSTKPLSEFINYLYDINYIPAVSNSTNKKCYYSNPNIASVLMTSDTINAKNSDGNTPLHLAVNSAYPKLVELLIEHGANAKSFRNLKNRTPYDTSVANLATHIGHSSGETVENTLSYFIEPFNDMLIGRLTEAKYKNNIIKNVTLGIPIRLIMYNHMFHLYLENYRYGFSFELKNKIIDLFKKYYKLDNVIYPVDLFIVDNPTDLDNITATDEARNRANSVLTNANQGKIDFYTERLSELQIQKRGLEEEWKKSTTTAELNHLAGVKKLIDDLELKILSENNKISKMIPPANVDNTQTVSVYNSVVNSMKRNISDRSMDLVQFYNTSFSKLGRQKSMYVGIWNNYLHKNIDEAPSMIFPLVDNIVCRMIINDKSVDQKDLDTISEFYTIVNKYIELRAAYPDKLDENPILQEDFKQLVYIINLILTPAVQNILLSQIYTAIKEMDSAELIVGNNGQINVIESITTSKFNGQTINSYVENILPTKALKYYSGIYLSDEDPDRKITNAVDLFLPIVQIAKSNKLVQITDDSLLVQNLNNYLIPFISNTYHNFIHHVRLAAYGYDRYILGTGQLIRIFQLLNK